VRAAAIAAQSPDVAATIRALQQPVPRPGTGTASGAPAEVITRVDAGCKSIGDAGAAAIAKALAARPSSTVTKVWRPNCRMPLLGGVRPDSTVSMFFFRFATVLLGRQLVLDSNAIGDAGARALAGALAANATLRVLQLWNNSIGAAGGTALAKALTVNHTLTNVCAGQFRDGGCDPYIRWPACELVMVCALSALLVGICVQLGLHQNKIGDSGATAMAEMLAVNSTLQSLSLPSNSIGSHGASALAKALASNRTLTAACGGGCRDGVWMRSLWRCVVLLRSCCWAATRLAIQRRVRLPRRSMPTTHCKHCFWMSTLRLETRVPLRCRRCWPPTTR